MGEPDHPVDEHFRPLRPATGVRWVSALVFGPLVWLIAVAVASVVVERTDAIAFGLLIAGLSFVVGAVALTVLRWARDRERRRYERS